MTNNNYDVKLAEARREHNTILAQELVNNIKKLAANPEKIDNFESYLSYHFDKWFRDYANTPEGLIYELQSFAGDL